MKDAASIVLGFRSGGWPLRIALVACISHALPLDEARAQEQTIFATRDHESHAFELKEFVLKNSKEVVAVRIVDERTFAQEVSKAAAPLFVTDAAQIQRLKNARDIDIRDKNGALGLAGEEMIHIVSLQETNITDIKDLALRRLSLPVSLGPKSQATETHALDAIRAVRQLSRNSGFTCSQANPRRILSCENDAFDDQPAQLAGRKRAAYFVTWRVPNPRVKHLAGQVSLSFAKIPDDVLAEMNRAGIESYQRKTIDLRHYGGTGLVPTAGFDIIVASTPKASRHLKVTVAALLYEKNPFVRKEALPRLLVSSNKVFKYDREAALYLMKYDVKFQ